MTVLLGSREVYRRVSEKSDSSKPMCDYISEMIHPLDQSFKILGRRWASPVLLELPSGKDRFNVLLGALPGVSPKTLSARLQDFQRSGLVERQELETRPKQVRYALTEKGEEFRALARELVGFSLKWHRK